MPGTRECCPVEGVGAAWQRAAMASERSPVRRSDDVVLAGERRGSPGAPAVVFLHANVADRRAWSGVLDLLETDDLDLIAYDRRGFGETPPGDPEVPFTHLDDLVAVLDAAGIERALVVGNSYGGSLALDLAATPARARRRGAAPLRRRERHDGRGRGHPRRARPRHRGRLRRAAARGGRAGPRRAGAPARSTSGSTAPPSRRAASAVRPGSSSPT